jgi:hypothetical protein
MKNKVIITSLILGNILFAQDTVYDGTASLIKSAIGQESERWTYNGENYWGWGMHQDEADMHHHEGKTSTVSFQWIYQKSTCHHINLTTPYTDNKLNVIIKSKGWAETTTKTYIATLSKTGISIPTVTQGYDTVFVTSKDTVGEKTAIVATCMASSIQNLPPESNDISLPKINNRELVGNASIISIAGKNTDGLVFGVREDEGITLTNRKSVMAFQVLSTNECRSIVNTLAKIKIQNNRNN